MDDAGTKVCTVKLTIPIIKLTENESKYIKKAVPIRIKTLDTNDIEHMVNAMKNMFFSALFSFISF